MNELATQPERETAISRLNTSNEIAPMLQAIIEKGITADTVGVMERLTALYLTMEDRRCEKEFDAAFAAMQADLPAVLAVREAYFGGKLAYKFAPLHDILKTVKPILIKHRFGYSFNTRLDATAGHERIIATCTLTYENGWKKSADAYRRLGGKQAQMNDVQADASVDAYAERGAFCKVLGIDIQKDNDARTEGDLISPEMAASLQARVKATGSDEAKFLAFAGAKTYATIMDSRYDSLDEMLTKREHSQAANKKAVMNPASKEKTPLAGRSG